MKKALITGVTGQDGSLLLKYLLEKNYEVHGLKRRASSFNTQRIDEFYESNKNLSKNFIIHFSDMIDFGNISRIVNEVKPDEIYHLAAMSHVRVSFDLPLYAGEVNALGTHKILEAVRLSKKKIKFYNASTSELYGDVQETPQTENTPFYPRSPYGVAKLYAHWMTKHYREAYGIFASNGILFNHESEYRGETFVTRKITRAATRISLGIQNKLTLGNLEASRDWGFAGDYVEGMWLMMNHKTPDDWVLATGETHTVREFVEKAFSKLGLNWEDYVETSERYHRPNEVKYLLGDPSKAKTELGWENKTSFQNLVDIMIDSDLEIAKREKVLVENGLLNPTWN
jgi:GDPmannose 4,6-dehydratase